MEDSGFLGRGWGFPLVFEKQGHHAIVSRMVEGESDINESLRILLSTRPGERLIKPEYGCHLHQMVFESNDVTTKTRIKEMVRKAVLFFEPRVELMSVEVQDRDGKEGQIAIKLEYVIRSTNSRGNMVYPFYFLEGNDID